jgi:hypothetical protein
MGLAASRGGLISGSAGAGISASAGVGLRGRGVGRFRHALLLHRWTRLAGLWRVGHRHALGLLHRRRSSATVTIRRSWRWEVFYRSMALVVAIADVVRLFHSSHWSCLLHLRARVIAPGITGSRE